MKLLTLLSLPNEPMLEKWARLMRYAKADVLVEQTLKEKPRATIIDYGCGQDILYYKYLHATFPKLSNSFSYIGIDPLMKKTSGTPKQVTLKRMKFEDVTLSEKADLIVMFAVLEHVDDALLLLQNAAKHLQPNGKIILTTPSPLAKLPLEFFSKILGIISVREIEEHKRYPTKQFMNALMPNLPGLKLHHEYFEFGLNNFAVLTRDATRTR